MRKKWASAYTVKVFHFLFQDGKSSHELVCSVSYCWIVTFVNHYNHILYVKLCFDNTFSVE
jgi:hypothetical protein